jgi:hypothetical protein
MREAFCESATLQIVVQTGAISFPPKCQGLEQIADALVRSFCRTYDNVYTFCLDPPAADFSGDGLRCRWLVGMTAKADGAPRVGCGRYDWRFAPDSGLAESLVITIEAMQVLAAADAGPILLWLAGLPYPWCSATAAVAAAPTVAGLRPVVDRIVGCAAGGG